MAAAFLRGERASDNLGTGGLLDVMNGWKFCVGKR
jgi:hypothetical protein